jgi:predicted signal transduction protein with EAL and GGDEF domain
MDPSNSTLLHDVLTSPDEIANFVMDLTADVRNSQGQERRAEPLYAIMVPVFATPFDAMGHRAGDRFLAVTRDISTIGGAILHSANVPGQFLLLEFHLPGGREFRLVLEILRVREIGPL